jgi:hypothetical protein
VINVCSESKTIAHLITSTALFEKWLQCRFAHLPTLRHAGRCNNRLAGELACTRLLQFTPLWRAFLAKNAALDILACLSYAKGQ